MLAIMQRPYVFAAWLLLAVLLPATQVFADRDSRGPYQYGNVIYTLPDGWTKGATRDDHVVIYDDEDESALDMRIDIFRSEPLPRVVPAWLQTFAKAHLAREEEQIDGDLLVRTERVGRTDVGVVIARVDGELWLYVGMPVGDRVELLRFQTDLEEQAASVATKLLFEQFLPSLRFESKGTPPVAGRPKPGPLEGVYFGTKYGYGLNAQVRFDPAFHVYDKAGHFIDEIPDGTSLTDVDLAELIREHPNDGGYYDIDGDTITYRYLDGTVDTDDLVHEDDFAKIKPGTFWFERLDPPADGTKLDGTYRYLLFAQTGSMISGNNTTFTQTRMLRLTQDGRFLSEGVTATSGEYFDVTYSGFRENAQIRGSYKIKDSLLVLTSDDGANQAHTLLVVNDSMIFLDGRMYRDKSKEDE